MFDKPTYDAMIRHGVTFDQKLAEAWRVADATEAETLLRAFPERFTLARLMADTQRKIEESQKPVDAQSAT